jgi:hypothetical protein
MALQLFWAPCQTAKNVATHLQKEKKDATILSGEEKNLATKEGSKFIYQRLDLPTTYLHTFIASVSESTL